MSSSSKEDCTISTAAKTRESKRLRSCLSAGTKIRTIAETKFPMISKSTDVLPEIK